MVNKNIYVVATLLLSMTLVGCSKTKEGVFLENTTKERDFNIKEERYMDYEGIEENQIFQSLYSENGYIYGVVRTLVDSNNNVIKKNIGENKKLKDNYYRVLENKLFKMDSKGKVSFGERAIVDVKGENIIRDITIDELNQLLSRENLGDYKDYGLLGTIGYNEKGELGIGELGKEPSEEILYKFSEKYRKKIEDGYYPSTNFIDSERRYMVSVFFVNKTEGNIEQGAISDIVLIDREEKKEYILYGDKNKEKNKTLEDFKEKKRIAYNKKNNKFFVIGASGTVEELIFDGEEIELKKNGDFKEIQSFFNLYDKRELVTYSIEDKIVLYNKSGSMDQKLMFIYDCQKDSGNIIGAEQFYTDKVYKVFEENSMFLIGPKDSINQKTYTLFKLEAEKLVPVHEFSLGKLEEVSDVFFINENSEKSNSIILEVLKRKNGENENYNVDFLEKDNADLESKIIDYNSIKDFEEINYLKLILSAP
ncbi:hypothetical protein [Clostridium massiliamazoniense]|uniref:hypothetical protein n=1 Tax=Clostridium massiliamazoniense TaxID=1347366 RepID=UPI0006D7F194|nr:hypothetical protein [Clostridium massiliamazoniense]